METAYCYCSYRFILLSSLDDCGKLLSMSLIYRETDLMKCQISTASVYKEYYFEVLLLLLLPFQC